MHKGSLAETILTLLKKHHFLSPLEMQEKLAEDGSDFNKTSIYRAIDTLLAEDLICKQDFLEKEACYELKENHHDHLLCISCGMLESVECLLPDPKMINDFTVDHHHLTIFGYCKACQAQQEKN